MGRLEVSTLRSRIESIDSLPTISGMLRRLLEVLQNPRISLGEISNFIENDPALAMRVLKMINSPIYGFPRRISSVNQAVILLGINVVKGLLLGVSVFDLIQKGMVGLWEHSMACAIAARLISKEKGLKEPEEVSAAGVLHDVGKVILALRFQKEYEEIVASALGNDTSILAAEKEFFGLTHADAGAWMGQKWNFPKTLVDTIAHHHDPSAARVAPVEAAIVHVADTIVRARGLGFAGDRVLGPVNAAAWEELALSESTVKMVLKETEYLLEESEDLFT
jgi:putative nucleotidyltransferase with HDIG domain